MFANYVLFKWVGVIRKEDHLRFYGMIVWVDLVDCLLVIVGLILNWSIFAQMNSRH
jgi:hypothetical protein